MRIQTIKSALRKYRRIYNTLIVAISISVFTYFYVSPEHPQYLVVATTSLLLCLMLGLFLVFSGKLVHLSIFIPTFLLWLYFCAPFFYSNFPDWDSRRVVDPVYFDEMALYCTLSIMGLVLGYYLATKIIKIPPIFYPNVRLNKSTLTTYAWVFLIIWWIYMVIKQVIPGIFFPFGQTIAILKHFNLFGGAFALITFLRGKYSGILILFALFSFLTDIFVTVQTTLFAWNAYLLTSLLVVIFIERRRLPWKTALLLLCFALPVFLARFSHRPGFRYWSGHLSDRLIEGVSIAIQDIASVRWAEAAAEAKQRLGTRFEGVSFLAHCIYLHKNGRPFKKGETFWFVPLSVIPRFFFPWKPENDHGDTLATEYGFKDPGGYVSINFLWLAELYINFNFIGMVLGSTMMGIFICFAGRCCSNGVGDLNLLIFLQLLYWLTNMESNLAMITGGILQTLVVWWLLSFSIRRGKFRYYRYYPKLYEVKKRSSKLNQQYGQPSLSNL